MQSCRWWHEKRKIYAANNSDMSCLEKRQQRRRSPPENLKDWLMQSSEKTKPRKTSNMMHVVRSTKVKNALLKFE